MFIKSAFPRSQHILLYGGVLAVLVFLLKWLQWNFLIMDHSIEIYIGVVALFFTILGIWIATQLVKPKIEKVVVEKEIFVVPIGDQAINEIELAKLNLSNREYEVLQLLSKGLSNAEIAENLFLSLSTIKTHVSNLYIKMDVKSRVQAVDKAKKLQIIK